MTKLAKAEAAADANLSGNGVMDDDGGSKLE